MERFIRNLALFASVMAAVAGCSDGGGDGGGGNRGIRILHAGIDSAPYHLQISGKEENVLQTSRFSLPDHYFSLPSGQQTVVAVSAAGTPAFTFSMPKERPAKQSILIYGSRSFTGVRAALFADEAGEIPAGMSAVRIIHGVERFGSMEATVGNVTVAQGVTFGSAAAYVMVPAGVQQVRVKGTGQGSVLFSSAVEFAAKKAYSLWAAGEAGYFVVVRVVQD